MSWVRATGVVAILAVALLAGCITMEDDGSVPDAVRAGRAPPEWAVGHYWTMDAMIFGNMTLVVVDDTDEEWIVGTSNEALSWFNFLDEVSFLDHVRKADLAGSQAGERIRFLDFPLQQGKNWTTYWGEGERLIEVDEVGDTFTLKGYDDGALAVVYVYDPVVGWFTEMEYYDEDGEVSYRFTLTGYGVGFTDEVARWSVAGRVELTGDAPAQTASLSVSEASRDIFISFRLECEGQQGTYLLRVHHGDDLPVSPPGGGYTLGGDCEAVDEEAVIADPEPGPWEIRYTQVFLPEMPRHEIHVWLRELHWDTVGPGGESEG